MEKSVAWAERAQMRMRRMAMNEGMADFRERKRGERRMGLENALFES